MLPSWEPLPVHPFFPWDKPLLPTPRSSNIPPCLFPGQSSCAGCKESSPSQGLSLPSVTCEGWARGALGSSLADSWNPASPKPSPHQAPLHTFMQGILWVPDPATSL